MITSTSSGCDGGTKRQEGQLLPTGREQAEQERERAKLAEEQLEQERQKSDRLAARL